MIHFSVYIKHLSKYFVIWVIFLNLKYDHECFNFDTLPELQIETKYNHIIIYNDEKQLKWLKVRACCRNKIKKFNNYKTIEKWRSRPAEMLRIGKEIIIYSKNFTFCKRKNLKFGINPDFYNVSFTLLEHYCNWRGRTFERNTGRR